MGHGVWVRPRGELGHYSQSEKNVGASLSRYR